MDESVMMTTVETTLLSGLAFRQLVVTKAVRAQSFRNNKLALILRRFGSKLGTGDDEVRTVTERTLTRVCCGGVSARGGLCFKRLCGFD